MRVSEISLLLVSEKLIALIFYIQMLLLVLQSYEWQTPVHILEVILSNFKSTAHTSHFTHRRQNAQIFFESLTHFYVFVPVI